MSDGRHRPRTLPDAAARAALAGFDFVSPAVGDDLERFVALLRQWQRTHNLVSKETLGEVWSRHVADSLQLVGHAPPFSHWVDLGSGAGLPGLVVAVAFKENRNRRFTLVESNGKKAAFLRAAIRATGANATVAAERIEAYAGKMAETADVVSARALAPVARICGYAAPLLRPDGALLLLKGQSVGAELDEAARGWEFDAATSPSATDPGGRVVVIRQLRRKGGGA